MKTGLAAIYKHSLASSCAAQSDMQAPAIYLAVELGMSLCTAAGRSGEELFGSGASNSSNSVQAMERNVARLFSERGPIFGEIEFTQNSILSGNKAYLAAHFFPNFACRALLHMMSLVIRAAFRW